MSTAKEKREALATLIRATLSTSWTVYAAPPESVTTPAVVIAPRSPYRAPETFTTEAVGLAIQVIVPRISGPDGLDALDAALDLLIRGTEPVVGVVTAVEVSSVSQATANGADVLVATINVTMV